MKIIGVTGSIGMGKSTTARQIAHYGGRLQDADKVVHSLLANKGLAYEKVINAFPFVRYKEGIDRRKLAQYIFEDPQALKTLEAIIHPLVKQERLKFIRQAYRDKAPFVVLDIPLLFENNIDKECDLVAVVTAPDFIQKQRVLARPHMTQRRLQSILQKQLSSWEKQIRADVLFHSSLGLPFMVREVKTFMAQFLNQITPFN